MSLKIILYKAGNLSIIELCSKEKQERTKKKQPIKNILSQGKITPGTFRGSPAFCAFEHPWLFFLRNHDAMYSCKESRKV
jgi:hypothetical protein